MCGVAAIIRLCGSPVDPRQLETLRDLQAHRGPDGAGIWLSSDRSVGLAHRRLAIVDLSPSGAQPMQRGSVTITFNGEIYNYRALRSELIAKGHRFRTGSDTEVILAGYDEWGIEVVHRLRGMFAFVLYDDALRVTFAVRDPLGIKPLYHSRLGDEVAFASEVGPLEALAARSLDERAIASYLLWGSIAAPSTLYKEIRAVPPGSIVSFGPGTDSDTRRYYYFPEAFVADSSHSGQEAISIARAAIRDSVSAHLVADVEVGAFLSGGVDSSVIVGIASEFENQDAPVRTITVQNSADDEVPVARQTAAQYGMPHQVASLRTHDALESLVDATDSLDQPSVDGINTYFVSKAASELGLKVALSGVGADEIFGGYGTFGTIPRTVAWSNKVPPPVFRSVAAAARLASAGASKSSFRGKVAWASQFGSSWEGAYYMNRGIFSPDEAAKLLAASRSDIPDPVSDLRERVSLDGVNDGNKVSVMEFGQYLQSQLLRDTDAMGMRHSLEIRTPFVDSKMLSTVAPIEPEIRLAAPAKKLLRSTVRDPLNEQVWNRPKRGFGLPFDEWLRSSDFPMERPRHEILDTQAVDRVFEQFESGRVHWSRVWALLVLGRYICK